MLPLQFCRDEQGFDPRSRAGSDAAWSAAEVEEHLFRSALPRGERRWPRLRRSGPRRFRSALPRGERHGAKANDRPRQEFRSALPRGERLCRNCCSRQTRSFRSALPRGERPVTVGNYAQYVQFRSALPRGERPERTILWRMDATVSIRAPARGATVCSVGDQPAESVSIRAPARGATAGERRHWCRTQSFDPRSRAGSDPCQVRVMSSDRSRFDPRSRAGSDSLSLHERVLTSVSIRAPARGATSGALLSARFTRFRSALPRGERPWRIKFWP